MHILRFLELRFLVKIMQIIDKTSISVKFFKLQVPLSHFDIIPQFILLNTKVERKANFWY